MPSSTTGSTANWIKLENCPLKSRFSRPILFGDDEGIIVVPYGKCKSIQIYMISSNTWIDFVRFKNQIEMKYNTIAMNPTSNNTIYLYDGKVYELDAVNKALIKIKNKEFQMDLKKNAYLDSCILNKSFHVFGGTAINRHSSWNVITNAVNHHNFINDNVGLIKGFGLISIESENKMLLMGGRDDSRFRGYLRSIYIFSNSENEWIKSNEHFMPHAMESFGCIITENEKNILIFGGKSKSLGLMDEIGILNLESMRWIKSDLKCPKKSKYFAIKTKYSNDVHLFDEAGNHYKMNLSNIFSKKYEQTLSRVKKTRATSGFDTEFKTDHNILLFDNKHRNSKKNLFDTEQQLSWLKCKNTPMIEYCRPVVTSNGSIIVSPYNQTHLLIYNDNDQSWKKLIKYPLNMSMNISHHTITLDSKHKKLYLFNGNFVAWDLNTKSMRTYGKISNVGKNPVSCLLNGDLNVIGGDHHSKHLRWMNDTKQFVEQEMPHPQNHILQGHGIIVLEKKKQIILFGGNRGNLWNGYMNSMWSCSNNNNDYIWNRLLCNMPKPMSNFGYIITNDEKYLIIIGGRCEQGLIDDIFVLSLSTWRWSIKGKAPKKAMYHAVICNNDDIHLFEINSTNHYKLALSSIITENMKQEFNVEIDLDKIKQNGVRSRAQTTGIIDNIEFKENFFKENNESDLAQNQLILKQQQLIQALRIELSQTKAKLMKIEQSQQEILHENEELQQENRTLRNNISSSLNKISMSFSPCKQKNGSPSPYTGSQRLLRKLQRSDTFLVSIYSSYNFSEYCSHHTNYKYTVII